MAGNYTTTDWDLEGSKGVKQLQKPAAEMFCLATVHSHRHCLKLSSLCVVTEKLMQESLSLLLDTQLTLDQWSPLFRCLYTYETSEVPLHVFPVSLCLHYGARTVWGLVGARYKVLTWCLSLWPKRKVCGWGWRSVGSEKDTAWYRPVSGTHQECMGRQCIPMGMSFACAKQADTPFG